MHTFCYSVTNEGTSPVFTQAFALGCGGTVVTDRQLRPGLAAIWGSPQIWPLVQQAMRESRLLYGDHGYFGRGKYYRVTKNAYQHTGIGTPDAARFAAFGRPVQPWRSTGSHVLVCPNSPTYFRLFGLDVHTWIDDVVGTIRQCSDRPIRIRWKTDTKLRPIVEDLKDCWAVVAFSSSAAIDALIAGVPQFTLAPFAAAYRMGLSDLTQIDTPVYPGGREDFCGVLAGQQWTLDEIRAGMAWRALMADEVAYA